MSENPNESADVTQERVHERVISEPAADEGGPLGNVTRAVTDNPPQEQVVERTEERRTEHTESTDNEGDDSSDS